MEIIQQGKTLLLSATETGRCDIGSMTCPPPPLTQPSLVWTVDLSLCKRGLAA